MRSPRVTWIRAADPPESFPDIEMAFEAPNGLLAAGGDLSEPRLLHAYSRGIFPWFSQGQPILWWSPNPRCVIQPTNLHIPRRLARFFKNSGFQITFNSCFDNVIAGCSKDRLGQEGTWITDEMQEAYTILHKDGWAHSVEVWQSGRLAGGLYGVAIGKVFFGESMFSDDTNASKAAMFALCSILIANHFVLLDCQVNSPHVLRMGAEMIPRQHMSKILKTACTSIVPFDTWPSETLAITDFNY